MPAAERTRAVARWNFGKYDARPAASHGRICAPFLPGELTADAQPADCPCDPMFVPPLATIAARRGGMPGGGRPVGRPGGVAGFRNYGDRAPAASPRTE